MHYVNVTQAANQYFPITYRALRNGPLTRGGKAEVLHAALVETLLVLPKVALGTRLANSARDALRPQALSVQERGAVGCASLALGKLTQLIGASIGAGAGAVASGAGMLFGLGGRHWCDLAAGKGWQLGTLVGTCLMSLSELARTALLIVAFALFTGTMCLREIVDILQQGVDLFRSAPIHSQVA